MDDYCFVLHLKAVRGLEVDADRVDGVDVGEIDCVYLLLCLSKIGYHSSVHISKKDLFPY